MEFWQMLNRVQSASAARMPGIALGYADGSHGSVSPERMGLERRAGKPPTVEAVAAWEATRPSAADADTAQSAAGAASPRGQGGLTQLAVFRRRIAQALRTMDRSPATTRTKKRPQKSSAGRKPATAAPSAMASSRNAAIAPTTPAAEGGEARQKTGRGPGPLARIVAAIDEQWSDLVESPKLPPSCGLAAGWVHRMAKHGQPGGTAYAPKTLRNYWYSWALRFIEEFGPVHPRHVSPAECEEIYLQIVEDAEVKNRKHLYAPMRNFHRYLVLHHGVAEIEWSQLRAATGQGLTYVDANIIHEHEYLKALELLRKDEAVSPRVQVMQAAVLVLLYRFGLRIAECLGLQARDVAFDAEGNRWLVRVRGNQYRGLKTFNARRTVVGLETLTGAEAEVLKSWAAHVETFASGTDVRPFFAAAATGGQRAELFPRRVIALRVGQALRAASGEPPRLRGVCCPRACGRTKYMLADGRDAGQLKAAQGCAA